MKRILIKRKKKMMKLLILILVKKLKKVKIKTYLINTGIIIIKSNMKVQRKSLKKTTMIRMKIVMKKMKKQKMEWKV